MTSTAPIVDNLNPSRFESHLLDILDETNRLYRTKDYESSDIATAKMVRYCIRMLHSHGWHPRTVVRAMVLMEAESETERSVKGFLYQAMRQKRDELRARRAVHEFSIKSAAGERGNDEGVDEAGRHAAVLSQAEMVEEVEEAGEVEEVVQTKDTESEAGAKSDEAE